MASTAQTPRTFIAHLAVVAALSGCGTGVVPPSGDPAAERSGAPAEYLGSAACMACHTNLATRHTQHGHSQALKVIEGLAPTYPAVGEPVGVADPPAGFSWFDIDFVMGGYTKAALFLDGEGFILTDGTAGTLTQYNLANAAIQSPAQFVPFEPDQVMPHAFAYECFRCHTTGPQSFEMNGGRRQGNRAGIEGTWAEAGVQCEACHGPGGAHLPNPWAGNTTVTGTSASCAGCHANPLDPYAIAARDLLIVGTQQFAEVAASPHRCFSCTVCHDPHASVLYDRDVAIRNTCRSCHADANMALHKNATFTWGSYAEAMSCESCHMPLAARNAAAVEMELPGNGVARIGDTPSHIMYINTTAFDPAEMFSADGSEVIRDGQGLAAVAASYVCQRCHHLLGNAFALTARESAELAAGIHQR